MRVPIVLILVWTSAVACADSAGVGEWVTDLQVQPQPSRVDEGEAVRITFLVRDRRSRAAGFSRSVAPTIRSIEVVVSRRRALGGERRTFVWTDPTPGHKVAIWDGTFEGQRNRPPESGRYRVRARVTDSSGRRQTVSGSVRLSNAAGRSVLPRTHSGLGLALLRFDGETVSLLDRGGNEIRVRAVSGLRADNPENETGIDYTHPRYQSITDRGPIPQGLYYVLKDQVQFPDVRNGELQYTTGGTLEQWGPIRVPMHPAEAHTRFGFFLHLDPADDGTAGCIGVHPADEGRFNQMMSLLSWMPQDSVPFVVDYGSS